MNKFKYSLVVVPQKLKNKKSKGKIIYFYKIRRYLEDLMIQETLHNHVNFSSKEEARAAGLEKIRHYQVYGFPRGRGLFRQVDLVTTVNVLEQTGE